MISNLNTDGSAVSIAHVQRHAALPQVTRFGPDVWAASSSDPAKAPYKVERLAGGTFRCSCEGNATWGRECRHIKAVRASLPAPAPVFVCIECGQYPAKGESVLCRRCMDRAASTTLEALPVDEAEYLLVADVPEREAQKCIGCGYLTCRTVVEEEDGDPFFQCEGCAKDVPVEATPIYRETLLSVCYAAPEGGSTDALHGAIAEGRARHEAARSRERHAKALAAPVGTFTLLAGPQFGLGE